MDDTDQLSSGNGEETAPLGGLVSVVSYAVAPSAELYVSTLSRVWRFLGIFLPADRQRAR